MTDAIQFHSQVDDDGVLNVQVDLGRAEAKKEVVVTIQPVSTGAEAQPAASMAWSEFVARTYGSCAGFGLERHEQGNLEVREPLA